MTETFGRVGVGKSHPTAVFVVLGLLCLVPVVVVLIKFLRTRDEQHARRLGAALLVLTFVCSVSAGTFGSYLGFMSARHAMEARYLALVWPFLVLSLMVAGSLLVPRLPAAAALPALVLLAGLGWS